MRLTVLAFAAAAALPGAAAAQECDRADESQTGMNICAATDYRAADAELNADLRQDREAARRR